jgi:hypothetical protein
MRPERTYMSISFPNLSSEDAEEILKKLTDFTGKQIPFNVFYDEAIEVEEE